jgi:hypothetical protein
VRLRLRGVRFVTDVAADATATWNTATGEVTARVRLFGPRWTTAELRMSWNDLGRHPRAAVTGTAGGARLAATLPAP